jgi:hypothetical protein
VTPETYIVRVYRRGTDSAKQIAGLVETPGGSLSASFTDLRELAAILEAPKKHLHQSEPGTNADAGAIKLYRHDHPRD